MSFALSRLRLRRDASLSALAPLLAPEDDGGRTDRSHRLLWAVFSDSPDRERDFLWREENPGHFLVLSARAPLDPHDLFEIETKPFEPNLAKGDRLRFVLRANAVITLRAEGMRGKRTDIVMHRLHEVPTAERRSDATRLRTKLVVIGSRDKEKKRGLSLRFARRRPIVRLTFRARANSRSRLACWTLKGSSSSVTFRPSFRR